MPEPSSRIEQASLFRPCIAGFSAQAGRLQQARGRAGVAQLVEQRTCNAKVEGSIPFSGTKNLVKVLCNQRLEEGFRGCLW